MSLLIDAVPWSVTVQGKEWPVSADFRKGILFEQLMLDGTVPDEWKAQMSIELWFPAPHPPLCQELMDIILWLYLCGKEHQKQRVVGHGAKSKKVFDYDQDDEYIYAAFLQQYRIDLESADNLHWWKFKALLDALDKDCMFCKIMEWRATDTTKLKGDQKDYILRMQRIYRLERPIGEQEKLDDIAAALMGDGDISNI